MTRCALALLLLLCLLGCSPDRRHGGGGGGGDPEGQTPACGLCVERGWTPCSWESGGVCHCVFSETTTIHKACAAPGDCREDPTFPEWKRCAQPS